MYVQVFAVSTTTNEAARLSSRLPGQILRGQAPSLPGRTQAEGFQVGLPGRQLLEIY